MYEIENGQRKVPIAIIINGKGAVGKDTLCGFVASTYRTVSFSAIDMVKNIARLIGWDGGKDRKSRKLLSDLKMLCIAYNDMPFEDMAMRYEKAVSSGVQDIIFMHIREPEEIDKMKKYIERGGRAVCRTLLVTSNRVQGCLGNSSDDDVDKYTYDYVYDNSLPEEEAESDFMNFFDRMVKESRRMG